jgi:hypothetical protein
LLRTLRAALSDGRSASAHAGDRHLEPFVSPPELGDQWGTWTARGPTACLDQEVGNMEPAKKRR